MEHLAEDEILDLLQGRLAGPRRAAATAHLASCPSCATRLAKDAAVDHTLWRARESMPAPRSTTPPPRSTPPPPRSRAMRWFATTTVAAAGAIAVYAGSGTTSAAVGEVTPMSLLAWYNLVFLIPLVVGVLLALGSAASGHDADGDHEAPHGGAVDAHDGDHDASVVTRALTLLGVGRVPLLLLLMVAALWFGGLGLISNAIFGAIGLAPGVFGSLSIGVALIGMVLLTGSTSRLVARVMPSVETYSVTRRDFEGCTGKLLLPADSTTGYAQIKDPEGNIHNIKCRTVRGTSLAKGTDILVVEYDEETQTFIVDANPIHQPSGS